MTILTDISYGDHERHRVDIYLPDDVVCKSGVIFYIHGGGWTSCDKSVHHPDCEHFCNLGYICATMNYRYVDGNITVYDEFNDITAALETVKEICLKNGFQLNRALLSGGSAGAHLAVMYAYTKMDVSPLEIACVCAYCPPVRMESPDFLLGISGEFEDWKYGVLSAACGIEINKNNLLCEEQQTALKKISPIEYVTENCVPTAVFHGVKDELVPFEHVVEFIKILNEKGVKNEFLVYENSGHAQDKDPDKSVRSKEIIKECAERYF